jgi:hypothetical protein
MTNRVRALAPEQKHPAGHRRGERQSHAPKDRKLQNAEERKRDADLVLLHQINEGLLLPQLEAWR